MTAYNLTIYKRKIRETKHNVNHTVPKKCILQGPKLIISNASILVQVFLDAILKVCFYSFCLFDPKIVT